MDAAPREPDLEALLRESAWVRGLARGLLADGAAAEDLAQDVLVAALDRRVGLEGARLRGWLRTVARRLAQRSRERRGLREDAERANAPPDDADRSAERSADRRVELQRELTAALAELEPADRAALVLRYFDGLSTGELALHLGLAEPAARKRVSRALERLRARLDARAGGERRAWSVALVAALGLRAYEAPSPALPIMPLLAGLMTKTIWPVATLIAACLWLAFSHSWSAQRPAASGAATAVAPAFEFALSTRDDSLQTIGPIARGERVALDAVAAAPTAPAARVRVVDPDGTAVADARAAWIDVAGSVAPLPLDPDGSAPRPGASARACFVAVAEGLGFGTASAGPQVDQVVITLHPTRTLTGRVLEDGGAPRESLQLRHVFNMGLVGISAIEFDISELHRALDVPLVSRVVLTEPDGSFSLSGLTAGVGDYLSMPSTHQLLSVDGHPQAVGSGRLWVGATTTHVSIEAARLPMVVGRMVWEDTEEPLSGTFRAYFRSRRDVNGTATTDWLDDQGRFSFGVPIEPHALQQPFESRSARLTERSVSVAPSEVDSKSLPFEYTIDLSAASFPLDVGTVRVPRAPLFHLRLVDVHGTPIRGAVVGSDLERASSDAEGLARIAVGQGTMRVLAFDCALGEFEVPTVPTSAEAPLELRLTPGATLEILAHRGDDSNPWAGKNVRISWSESPFHGPLFRREGRFGSLTYLLYRTLLGCWGSGEMGSGSRAGEEGWVKFMLPVRGPLLVPGLRPGATAHLELLDAADQPLTNIELRVPDAPRRFTADLTGLATDTGRLRLCATDTEGRTFPRASFFVRAQGGTHTKYVHVDGSSLDLWPVALGRYDVTVRVTGFLEQKLHGLEATLDAPERRIVLDASRTLDVALIDEAGQTLRAGLVELRGATGRWTPSRARDDEVAGWATVRDLPRAPLELVVVIGTRTWTRAVNADQTSLSLDLPVHGRLALRVHARELLTSDHAQLAVKLRELEGDGALEEEVAVRRGGIGPIEAIIDLMPGRYELTVDLEEHLEDALETAEPLTRPLLRRELEIRARERLEVVH